MQAPIRIERIDMYEAPRYGDQYYRPFHSHVSDLTNVVDELRQTTQGATMNSPASMAKASGQMIRPMSQAVGQAFIDNGWQERRFVFVMEVHCDSGFGNHTIVQYLSGYTDYVGVNPQTQSVDPMMRFFFNSVMSFRSRMSNVAGRGVVTQNVLQHAAHVITPHNHLYPAPQAMANGYPQSTDHQIDHLLRPQDLVNTLQTDNLLGHASEHVGSYNVMDLTSSAVTGAQLSRFGNGHVPEYLSKVIDAMQQVQNMANTSMIHESENWSLLMGQLQEPLTGEFNILTEFTEKMGYGQYGDTNSVTWGDMVSAFRDIADLDAITTVYFTNDVQRMNAPLVGAENAEAMGGSTVEVIAANMVINSLPGIMTQCMLAEFGFTATNEVAGTPKPYNVFPVGHPQTIAREADFRHLVSLALSRIETELCPMISNGNTIPFFIQVHASLVRDTTITVRIGDGDSTPFVVPTWGSAIFSPVTHSTHDNLRAMAHDVDSVFNATTNVQPGNQFVQPITQSHSVGVSEPAPSAGEVMSGLDF